MPVFHQIRRQPTQEDPEAINVSKIGTHDRPHIGRSEQRPPGHAGLLPALSLIDVALFVDPPDMFEFCSVHQPVFFWKIAIGHVPPYGPENADRAANIEYRSPAERRHDQHHNRWRNGCSYAARAVRDPLDEAALLPRVPKLHGAGCSRKRASFADTKKKANYYKRGCASGCGGCRGHNRPVANNDRQYIPRAESIAEPAAGNLKHGIGPDKGAEDYTHRDFVEAKFLADDWRRGRDIHPIK